MSLLLVGWIRTTHIMDSRENEIRREEKIDDAAKLINYKLTF